MLDKIDYGDLYKFLTSLGLVLILVGALMPMVALSDVSDLVISANTYEELSSLSKVILDKKFELLMNLLSVSTMLSLVFVFGGYCIFAIGLLNWRKRQNIEDKKAQAELDKMLKEQSASQLEATAVVAEAEALRSVVPLQRDAKAVEAVDLPKLMPTTIRGRRLREYYRNADSQAVEKLVAANTPGAMILAHQMLGSYEYDVIVVRKPLDIVLEIKLFIDQIPLNMLIEGLTAHIERTAHYTVKTGRNAFPVLLLVLVNGSNFIDAHTKVKEAVKQIDGVFRVLTMPYDDLVAMPAIDFASSVIGK